MRRRHVALLVALTVLLPAHAAANVHATPDAARDVRASIPAIEAYRADHGTYAGMTLTKIRRYDRSVTRIAVKRATKNAYCVQSTRPGAVAHFDGPRGPLRKGRCGVRGAVIAPAAPTNPDPPVGDAAVAQSRLRAAIPAIEAYNADHNGYTGLTVEKIHEYDHGVEGITVVWAFATEYCIEAAVGAETYHQHGPANGREPGHCPASP